MEETTPPAAPSRRRGRPPNSDGHATRERLLDAALHRFARQGYAATTVRQIAADARVRDSAIYGHFSGKEAIYEALLAEAGPPGQVLDLDVEELVKLGPTAAVRDLTDRLFDVWSAPRARLFFGVVMREGPDASGNAGLKAAIDATRDVLAGPFRRWQEAGSVRAGLEPRQLVWELFAPMQVPRFLYLRGDVSDADLATARRMIDEHVDFFLRTITTPDERAPRR